MAEYNNMFISLREHKYYSAYPVDLAFNQFSGTLQTTPVSAQVGRGYNFICFPAWYLHNKYIKFKIRCRFSNPPNATVLWRSFIMDGTYDRSSDTDFPTGTSILYKGNGQLQGIWNLTGANSDVTVTVGPVQIDVSNVSFDEVTIFFQQHDGWTGQTVTMWIDYIQICNSDASVIYWEQDCNGAVTMEQTGTQGDYGYMGSLNPCGTLFPPLEIIDRVSLRSDCCGILPLNNVLGWHEEEEVPIPTKRIIRKESPTTQAEYFTCLPRRIDIELKSNRSEKNELEACKHCHGIVELYDYDESFIDVVWIEALNYKWAGDEDHNSPWRGRLTLICSSV